MSRSETMISLQWSQFDSFILKGLKEMFACAEEFADVTLVCADGRAFKAHKLVLSMWSPYFREIFLNNVCDHPVIILRDTKSEDIQVILAFMYEGQALLHPENETRILETAVSLQIAGFSQMKEPTQIISSSTPTGSSQNLSLNTRTTYGSPDEKVPQQPRHTVIGISPIPIPTTVESPKNVIGTPATPVRSMHPSATSTTPVYKPHKRQKIELTPTKSPGPGATTSPSRITRVADDEQQNLTTMYSMDQQRIIIAEQEIPRCSSSSQELEFIEIINISPGQNSVTLTELETAPPLEPVETEASFIFGSTSPSDHAHSHAQTQSHAQQVLLSPGSSTNHRVIIKQEIGKDANNKEKKLNNKNTNTENFVPCPKCGKNVKETSLRVHLSRTHLEEGTILICPICSKAIHSKGVYYKHMFLHRKKDKKSADRHEPPN